MTVTNMRIMMTSTIINIMNIMVMMMQMINMMMILMMFIVLMIVLTILSIFFIEKGFNGESEFVNDEDSDNYYNNKNDN